ncbi:MAG: hypothetical protein IPK72_16145 [Candidatus Eisenbacteria bacterium]|nr:hypothetical protein [Candidatus Eisenbacteria bacterium]
MRWFLFAILLLSAPSKLRAQELLTPVAMASSGETVYLAYGDNSVWWAHGLITEIPAANRGVPILAMCPDPSGAFVVYADNQAWFVQAPNVCTFQYDMTRPDDPSRPLVSGSRPDLGDRVTKMDKMSCEEECSTQAKTA